MKKVIYPFFLIDFAIILEIIYFYYMANTVKIFLVGGGTGGHIFPLINLTQYLRAKNSAAEFHWIGEKNSLEEQLSVKNSIIFSAVICGKLRRYFSFETFLLPFQVLM